MPLAQLNSEFVENLLKTWKKGDFSFNDLKVLSKWLDEAETVEEKRILLRDKLYHMVTDSLPPACEDVIASRDSEKMGEALRTIFQNTLSDKGYIALIYARYLDIRKHSVSELAEVIGISKRTLRRYLLKGFTLLSIWIKEDIQSVMPTRTFASAKDQFPGMDTSQAFGIHEIVESITTWLLDDSTYQAVSIEGIGGIGKTLLATHLLQRLSQHSYFDDYAWVSARQKELSPSGEIAAVEDSASSLSDILTRLTHQLGQTHLAGLSPEEKLKGLETLSKQKRLLIVLDNLETAGDVEETVPQLLRLTGPSKLLATSRKSLSKFPQVRTFSTPELSFDHSRQLILSEMQRRGILLSLSDETLASLYDVTGGIPLALKLAAAQFGIYPAEEIIEQFRQGKENTQSMYTLIYRRAWTLLSDIAKKLLLTMLLVSPEGEERHWICETGGFTDKEFDTGVKELRRLSLIEFSGSIEAPRHRIHRLTATFLQTDILNLW